MLDFISKHSVIWLSLYLCGSVLVITAVATAFGGGAAGTVAGFLVLAGTVGYESLSRVQNEKQIKTKVSTLGINHDRLTREMARSRGEIDSLKSDISRTATLLKKQAAQKDTPAFGESITHRIHSSFEKMGTKPRATVSETARKYEDLLVKGATLEEENDIEEPIRRPRTDGYSDTIVSELLHHAVHNDRIEIFAQPIVRLPSRRLSYLELFARIRARAGVYLTASRYRSLAEHETLIADVDHLLLLHVLDSIRADARRKVELGYFINISAATLKDSAFMGDLLEFIRRSRDLSQNLILELQQTEFEKLSGPLMAIVKALSQAGCRFSVDNIQSPRMDISKLQDLKVEFIKIDAEKLVVLTKTSEGETMLQRLIEKLDAASITLIVEKMESDNDVRQLLDFDIAYGEGHLFGKPDLEVAYRPKKIA